jgi:hypothetical protein
VLLGRWYTSGDRDVGKIERKRLKYAWYYLSHGTIVMYLSPKKMTVCECILFVAMRQTLRRFMSTKINDAPLSSKLRSGWDPSIESVDQEQGERELSCHWP